MPHWATRRRAHTTSARRPRSIPPGISDGAPPLPVWPKPGNDPQPRVRPSPIRTVVSVLDTPQPLLRTGTRLPASVYVPELQLQSGAPQAHFGRALNTPLSLPVFFHDLHWPPISFPFSG